MRWDLICSFSFITGRAYLAKSRVFTAIESPRGNDHESYFSIHSSSVSSIVETTVFVQETAINKQAPAPPKIMTTLTE
jgi:hypothetical protein